MKPSVFILPSRNDGYFVSRVHELGANVQWLLETHVHADHLSAAPYLKERLGGKIAIGAHVTRVQDVFGKLFNAGAAFAHDGSQFDHLLADAERFAVGALQVRAIHTPGHTPACMTYVVSDGAQTAAITEPLSRVVLRVLSVRRRIDSLQY